MILLTLSAPGFPIRHLDALHKIQELQKWPIRFKS